MKKIKEERIPQLRKKLIRVFNAFIRARDANLPCISCGIRRVTQAGHYWSTSQCPQPAMRFNEKNVNGQCTTCNSFQEGNRQGYKAGLIKKYGPKIIEELDIVRSTRSNPWTKFEYRVVTDYYQQKKEDFIKQRRVG